MEKLVSFAHALADETRWRILQLVIDEPLCLCELADILEMPQSSVSSHVQVIKKSGLLESEKCEKWVYYRVALEQRGLLGRLAGLFQATPSQDETLQRDAERSRQRLAARSETCCPLPKSLTKLKPVLAGATHES